MRFCLFVLVISASLGLALSWDSSSVLNVHVVPHSHNDPGWWKTFEGYYQDWTKGILSSIVEILAEEKTRTFIWAEISYFQRWWEDQDETVRDTVKLLIKDGQLEFVTAGWVMNDEANAHMVDIINQLTEGHEWLYRTLKTKPKYGWAIDPFGHSPTMPYVLQQMGIRGMVINRAHRDLKQDFRDNKKLEFYWTGESLNSSSSFSMLAHMLPWKLYDIPNTCGPNWDICEKFDFERPVAIPITASNVKERSETLVNMYKEKAKLFRHNSVLIPLGDDFKYKTPGMTRKIMTQYEMLFKYINDDPKLGVNIKFSTLGQYFEDIEKFQSAEKAGGIKALLPVYHGDFFTYCDEGEDYWSGYFTTRPYMKGLTRSTQSILRTGEILATLARVHVGESVGVDEWANWFESLETARRNVALFQHHDGVTGTARREVVNDYADRLLTSLAKVADLSSDMALVVLSKSTINQQEQSSEKLTWTTEPARRPAIASARVLDVKKNPASVVIFNSLAHSRTEVVSVLVNNHEVEVVNSHGEIIAAQVDPVWEDTKVSSTQFTLHFVATVSGIGLSTYFVQPSSHPMLSSVIEYSDTPQNGGQIAGGWHYDSRTMPASLHVENSRYKLELAGQGTIKSVERKTPEGASVPNKITAIAVDQAFLSYSTFNGGAYLFLPRGSAQPLAGKTRAVRVVTGPVVVTVHSAMDSPVKELILRLYECNPTIEGVTSSSTGACPQSQGIELVHIVDLVDGNTEIITRFNTNISNSGHFYTDSNGLDMRERIHAANLPIQGNYYPITSAAYIESHSPELKNSESLSAPASTRFTVLSHQAHGAASLSNGALEIMLERRLNQDDGRGLGEPVTDNLRTAIPLWLVVESTDAPFDPVRHPAISRFASDVWHSRNYPLHSMFAPIQLQATTPVHEQWGTNHHLSLEPLSSPFHEELQLLTLAPRDKESEDIVLRVYYPPVSKISISKALMPFNVNMFKHLAVDNLKETSLSMMYDKPATTAAITQSSEFKIRPTEMRTFVIHLTPATVNEKQDLTPSPLMSDKGQEKEVTTKPTEASIVTSPPRQINTIPPKKNDKDIGKENNKNDNGGESPFQDRDDMKGREKDINKALTLQDDEVVASVDETELIPINKQEPAGNKEAPRNFRDKGDNGQKNGGEGRVGKAGAEEDVVKKLKDKSATATSNTTGLYAMSIMFYLGLLVVVVLGGWLLGRRRTHHGTDDKRNQARMPSIWKEREDSMMKLL